MRETADLPWWRRAPLGARLVLPAMVYGAMFGSLLDLLLWDGAFPLAKAGVVVGPVLWALALNALDRDETRLAAARDDAAEAWRREDLRRRMEAAEARGELVRFEKR